MGDRPGTRCDGPEKILQRLPGSWKYHGQQVAGVPGWMEKHQDSCNSNFTGSSPAMEAEGASILWGRSVEKNQLVISEGGAKTIARLNSEHPYGSDVILVITFMSICLHLWWLHIFFFFLFFFLTPPEDWVRGTHLKAPREKTVWPKEENICLWLVKQGKLKWGAKGHLTDAVIESLMVYFGGAIRNFPGDADGMFTAIWAVFHHSISDDQTHGANSIAHSLRMKKHLSTLPSCQRIWVPL